MTDEFYVAVTEFNLSWEEVKQLSRNSLAYAFIAPQLKQELLAKYNSDISRFERELQRSGVAKLGPLPGTRRFICTHYGLCN